MLCEKMLKKKQLGLKRSIITNKKASNMGVKLPSIVEEVSPYNMKMTEAREIIECVESMGITVLKNREETIQEVNKMLKDGNLYIIKCL